MHQKILQMKHRMIKLKFEQLKNAQSEIILNPVLKYLKTQIKNRNS